MEQIKLYKHQEDFLKIVKDHNCYLLAAEMGTGKTPVMIQHMRYLYNNGLLRRPSLIICPNIVTENWYREIGDFASKQMHDATVVLKGSKSQRLKLLNNSKKCIFIINYEGLRVIGAELIKFGFGLVICDEIHCIKSPKALQSKIAIEISKTAEYRYGMSGTPILNTMLDLFNIFLFLDHGALLGRNFFGFRARFFEDKNAIFKSKEWYFPHWEPKASTVNDLQSLIANKTFRVLKKDCLDLPDKVYEQVYVELTEEQKAHYENIKKELITEYSEGVVVAANALTKIQRLSQITSGLLFSTTGDVSNINSAKLSALHALLTDQLVGEKVIIWGVYRRELERIQEMCISLKLNPVLIYGGVNNKDELIQRFQTDDSCKVLIGQVGTGVGFTATAAKYAIYYTNNYSMKDRLQSEDRCHRVGSEIHDKITYIDIIATGTIDEVVLGALKNKKDMASAILDSLKGGELINGSE